MSTAKNALVSEIRLRPQYAPRPPHPPVSLGFMPLTLAASGLQCLQYEHPQAKCSSCVPRRNEGLMASAPPPAKSEILAPPLNCGINVKCITNKVTLNIFLFYTVFEISKQKYSWFVTEMRIYSTTKWHLTAVVCTEQVIWLWLTFVIRILLTVLFWNGQCLFIYIS
jgi:hypothetical protein